MFAPRASALFGLLAVALIPPAFSQQEDDGAAEREKARASASLGYYFNAESEIDSDSGGRVALDEWRLDLPVYGFKTDAIKGGVNLRYRNTQIKFDDHPFLGDQELHGIEIKADMLYQPEGSRWYGWAQLKPEAYGDGDSWSDGFGFGAIASVGYEITDDLSIAAGGYYGSGFGEYVFYPSLAVIWEVNDAWEIRLVPPKLTATFFLTEDTLIKFGLFPGGGSWALNAEDNNGVEDLNFRNIRVAIGMERRFNEKWWASVWAGGNVLQQIELRGEGDRELYKEDVRDSLFLYAGFRLDLR